MYCHRKLRQESIGFTLLELMIVVTIIGIFTVVAAPTITDLIYRNRLTDMVQTSQGIAHQARTLATQTKRAAVVEFRNDAVWINVLAGPTCWSGIQNRCLLHDASDGSDAYKGTFQLTTDNYQTASVMMCGGAAQRFEAGVCGELVLQPSGFALCYSGKGELFVRGAADGGTVCGGSGTVLNQANWNRGCYAPTTELEGARVDFNRYDGLVCGGPPLDVRRSLFFPLLGSPSSRVNP